ncbi:MAG: class I SAM-dependent RNA methyltransferase [Clostridia bacterium]|nr:class I SAM-dependent RNA methyltransferase [Clostridia bacterium]
MKLLIPCASGLEQVVKRQLTHLGYPENPAQNGRIAVKGEWEDVAKLNVFLRSGERVLIELACFPATNFDELFDGVYAIPWEEYMTAHSEIRIDGKSYKSALGAIKAAGGIVKKAIVKRLSEKLHLRSPRLDESGERFIVGCSIYEDKATITVDTSGEGLHKRGYRTLAYSAPLKETTAAALLDLTYYHPDKPLADLFCGSGTIPIEAAMRSLKIAPGLKRNFDFERWKCVKKGILCQTKEEANDLILRKKLTIFGGDLSKEAISIAKYHAKRAGVEQAISFRVADVKDFQSSFSYGILLSNPPYGERLSDIEEAKGLMKAFGTVYSSLDNWSAYFISGLPEAERYFGKRADKKKKLWNANIECAFYSFLGAPPKHNQ